MTKRSTALVLVTSVVAGSNPVPVMIRVLRTVRMANSLSVSTATTF